MSAYPGEHLGVSGGGGGKFTVGEELAAAVDDHAVVGGGVGVDAGDDRWTVRRGGGHGLFLTRGRSELLRGRDGQASDEAEGASRVLLRSHPGGDVRCVGVGRVGRQRRPVPVKTQRLLVVKLVGHTMPINTDHHHWEIGEPGPSTPRRSGAR